MTKSRLLISTALSFVAAVATVSAAQAQLEEITVTARKTEENLMTVPLAISALSTESIEARGLKTAIDLSSFTPGFFQQDTTSASTGRSDRSFQTLVFRGLNVAGNSGLNSGGSLFIDGAPVTSLTAAGFADVARVEVLRGPQSVYFGRSTFGGAVNYVTRDPNMESFQGRVAAEYGSYGSNEGTLSVEGPIVADKAAMRITAYHTTRGGQWTNAANTSEKLGKQSTDSVSATFLLKPSEGLSIKGYFNYYEDKDGAPAEVALNPGESNCVTSSGPYFCGKLPTVPARFISAYNVAGGFIQSQLLGNANHYFTLFNPNDNPEFGLRRWAYQSDVIVNYDTQSGYNFNSITAYHQSRWQAVDDLDFRDSQNVPNTLYGIIPGVLPFVNWTSLVQQKLHDFSEEVRISSPKSDRFRWVAGANYFSAYVNNAGYLTANFGQIDFSTDSPSRVRTLGVFGGAYYDVATALTLSLEARYQWDHIKAQFGTTSQLQTTFRAFTPRITLDYKINPDSTLYALYSRGARPGGFNSTLLALSANQLSQVASQTGGGLTYQQEKLDNFEIGFKNKFLDNRASIRAAAYYGVLKQQQTTSQVSVDIGLPTFNIYSVVLNVGQTDIFGFEFEGDWQATDHLLLSGTFDWAGSSIRKYNCLDCVTYHSGSTNVIGNHFNDVPQFTGTVSAQYTDHLAGDFDWFARLDYIYTGTIYIDLNNTAETGAANRVNLRLGVKTKDLSIEAFANNLTNDLTITGAYFGVDTVSLTNTELRIGLPMKRTFGVRASYSF